jgi:hypothetical protein
MFCVDHSPPFRARRLTLLQRLHRFLACLVGASALLGMVGCKKQSRGRYDNVAHLSDGSCVELVYVGGETGRVPVPVKCPPAEAVGP